MRNNKIDEEKRLTGKKISPASCLWGESFKAIKISKQEQEKHLSVFNETLTILGDGIKELIRGLVKNGHLLKLSAFLMQITPAAAGTVYFTTKSLNQFLWNSTVVGTRYAEDVVSACQAILFYPSVPPKQLGIALSLCNNESLQALVGSKGLNISNDTIASCIDNQIPCSNSSGSLPGWAIALIVIAAIIVLCGACCKKKELRVVEVNRCSIS